MDYTTKGNSNQNNFNGTTNFNGSVQFVGGNIDNSHSDKEQGNASYIPEPLWRSPFTLAILTWISVFVGILGVIPICQIIRNVLGVLKGNFQFEGSSVIQIYLFIFIGLIILFVTFISLRRIAKNQIRIPLFFDLAINGYGKRITIEKIHVDKCPQCGGKMIYYNKLVEWIDNYYSYGKRKITKKNPVLECKRNREHFYRVDFAEDKIK